MLAAAIAQACGDADAVEFTEVVWTSVGAVVYGTAATPGKPFVITSVTASGTGTFSAITTPTVSKGPNHWDDANNWTLAAVPVSTNDVDLTDCDVDILWGIDQNAVTLASLNIHSTFTGKIGNPAQEGDYYDPITRRAGQYAAEWTVDSMPAFRRSFTMVPAKLEDAALCTAEQAAASLGAPQLRRQRCHDRLRPACCPPR